MYRENPPFQFGNFSQVYVEDKHRNSFSGDHTNGDTTSVSHLKRKTSICSSYVNAEPKIKGGDAAVTEEYLQK